MLFRTFIILIVQKINYLGIWRNAESPRLDLKCQKFENLNATVVMVKYLVLLFFGLAMLLAVDRIQQYYYI